MKTAKYFSVVSREIKKQFLIHLTLEELLFVKPVLSPAMMTVEKWARGTIQSSGIYLFVSFST